MKFAKLEVINLVADVITTSTGDGEECPCFIATIPSTRECPTDE